MSGGQDEAARWINSPAPRPSKIDHYKVALDREWRRVMGLLLKQPLARDDRQRVDDLDLAYRYWTRRPLGS